MSDPLGMARVMTLVDAILQGGPTSIPMEERTCRIRPEVDRVKLRYGNGYEHFSRTECDGQGTTPVVFVWAGRTRIAE